MYVLHRLKLFLHQISNIVFRGNNQRPVIMSRERMNVKRVITEILFTGKGKIMQLYLILGNLPDIMKTFKRGEKEKIAIYQSDSSLPESQLGFSLNLL